MDSKARISFALQKWFVRFVSCKNKLKGSVQILVLTTQVIQYTCVKAAYMHALTEIYTVFQKKFTLLLFAITKSDVDRFL